LFKEIQELLLSINISVPIAPGELIDKITILEIKLERISAQTKLVNIKKELDVLTSAYNESIPISDKLKQLMNELKSVNEDLWDIEDDIRSCERIEDFGDSFIKLARSVYITNDKRMGIKRAINDLLGSEIVEEKSYVAY
tara:strand:+ start:582 stop:1001 length:420 start_codon:yes stop_codon:yes gene_type:complete